VVSDKILKAYLDTYKKLVLSERIRDRSAGPSTALSIPLHFSGNHRVEVTITEFSAGRYILSDMARTLGELAEGGRQITQDFRKKAEEIAGQFGTHFVLDHLICESNITNLGGAIQRFAEACKTIGDAYLLQRSHHVHVRAVVDQIKTIFRTRRIEFKEDFKVPGELEKHDFDVYVPPNGKPGVAIAVIAGHNTHALAKVWAFNCWDVRNVYAHKLKLGLVLDEEDSAPWTRGSRKILRKTADIVAPSTDLDSLEHGLLLEQLT
jgi:hypothetical protein